MKNLFVLTIIGLMLVGCSSKEMTYTTAGTSIGAGVGYAHDKDDKEAVIGGLVGGITGGALGKLNDHQNKKKKDQGFDQGYNQAKLDLALNHWDVNTGKQETPTSLTPHHLIPVKIKEQTINGIKYEDQIVILEDYQ